MKNRKVWKLILSVTMAAFLLWGCGSAEGELAEEAGAAEATAEESVIEEEKAEETEKEEQNAQQPVEEETLAEEESVADEEIATDMPEAQVTATVENIDGLVDYMVALDPETPHIVIYNEAEGYIIDMKEGEHYQLKSDDRIFINSNSRIKQCTHAMPEIKFEPISGAQEIIPDYSKFDKPQKCAYGILCEDSVDDELTYLICYLDPPIE